MCKGEHVLNDTFVYVMLQFFTSSVRSLSFAFYYSIPVTRLKTVKVKAFNVSTAFGKRSVLVLVVNCMTFLYDVSLEDSLASMSIILADHPLSIRQ